MKIIYQDFCDNGKMVRYLCVDEVVVINSSLPPEEKDELEKRFKGRVSNDNNCQVS